MFFPKNGANGCIPEILYIEINLARDNSHIHIFYNPRMALLTSKDTNSDKEMAFDFHFPTSKKALIIFTRNPELGKVKTRLAQSVGDESALNIYKFLVQHTVEITENLQMDKYVYYSEEIHKNDGWDSNIFRKKLQIGNDLGERMYNAFRDMFAIGYQYVIIIGCDMFPWEKPDLETAFEALLAHNFVIGPAMDGGYYLLGMREINASLFQDKNWGTHTVLEHTLKDLQGEDYILLKERNDIDCYEDLKNIEVFQQFLPENLKQII